MLAAKLASPCKTLAYRCLLWAETPVDLSQSFSRSIRIDVDHRFEEGDTGLT
ncbi:MAG: hypothetical protein IPP10_15000 [Candidatus Competibacteraceae bacterium]|nr:hypothetical protein [Candidatus Competibacteraceae bacterium]